MSGSIYIFGVDFFPAEVHWPIHLALALWLPFCIALRYLGFFSLLRFFDPIFFFPTPTGDLADKRV